MGRKSTKENKNIYQISRENSGLTRESAAEQLEFISSDRIEKIENEKSYPHPDEILAMADYPGFDLNDPRNLEELYPKEELKNMTDEETMDV